ncbi:MAG: RNA polymerase sigma factor RpoD/SigA [Phycisphaerales bacterium]|nr:RNA polymerase sigma factor RpoD/SigA [Phycisphaerales bacterium]
MARFNDRNLETYLRDINEVPLLTPLQERELGWRIINDGCLESKDRMIRANLRLVVAIGKQFIHRGMPLSDLIEEGNIGLIRAVEGFDPAQGARFSTYAAWWIKQAIKRMLLNATQPIHVPAYMVELIGRWRRESARLEEDLGRPPTIDETAKVLELPRRKAEIVVQAMQTRRSARRTGMSDDGDSLDFTEVLEDQRNSRPETSVERNDDLEVVLEVIEELADRDRRVLKLRFGLEGQSPLTLKQIGAVIGLTRERVRQIEMETLQRIQKRLSQRARPGYAQRKAS